MDQNIGIITSTFSLIAFIMDRCRSITLDTMGNLQLTHILILVAACYGIEIQKYKGEENACSAMYKDPYFEPELVMGKPWRIYYTWNMNLADRCTNIRFKNPTSMIINRIWNDMYEYMETQPTWDGATLHVSMGKNNHEMLMFAEPGAAGSYSAVPNVVRDPNFRPQIGGVPLLKFFMKLYSGGRFLLIMDCAVGVASLAARFDELPYRADIATVAAEVGLGEGHHACIKEKHQDEMFQV